MNERRPSKAKPARPAPNGPNVQTALSAPPQAPEGHRPLVVVWRRLRDLVPSATNARTHTEAQVEQIAASIREFGWTNPILLDEAGEIIAGHGRVLAGAKLAHEDGPTITLTGLTPEQKRAYAIADNRIPLNAGWDDAMLRGEIATLQLTGFDLGLLGFTAVELQNLLGVAAGGPSGLGNLAAKFGIPPFTILNAREGWWQDRKAAWIGLGIQSELGRGEMATNPTQSAPARMNDAAARRKAYAVPGGSRMPGVDKATGKIVRTDSRARPIPGTGRKEATGGS